MGKPGAVRQKEYEARQRSVDVEKFLKNKVLTLDMIVSVFLRLAVTTEKVKRSSQYQ